MQDGSYIPAIGVLIIENEKVLMVKHTENAEHLTDTYALPAGRLEPGESLKSGALRELFEETGIIAKEEDLIKFPKPFYADILRKSGETLSFKWDVFVAKKFTGEIRESDETIPEWVDLDKVKNLNLLINTQNAINEGLKILKSL